jgi:hypothetical protein
MPDVPRWIAVGELAQAFAPGGKLFWTTTSTHGNGFAT